jgi:hypothetical protein
MTRCARFAIRMDLRMSGVDRQNSYGQVGGGQLTAHNYADGLMSNRPSSSQSQDLGFEQRFPHLDGRPGVGWQAPASSQQNQSVQTTYPIEPPTRPLTPRTIGKNAYTAARKGENPATVEDAKKIANAARCKARHASIIKAGGTVKQASDASRNQPTYESILKDLSLGE